MSDYKVGFIGGGNMARALAGGLLSSGYRPENILIAEPDADRRSVLATELHGVEITADNHHVAAIAECLVLAVKPQLMRSVCQGLAETVQVSRPLIISVAAGTHSRDIDDWLGAELAVVRVMPNQPALLLEGATGLFANELTNNRLSLDGIPQRFRCMVVHQLIGTIQETAGTQLMMLSVKI